MKQIYLYMTPMFPSPTSWRGGFCFDSVKALMRDGRYDVRVMSADGGLDYCIDSIDVLRFKRFKIGSFDYCPYLLRMVNVRLFLAKIKAAGIDPRNVAICHVHEVSEYSIYAHAIKRINTKCLTLVTHHWMCDWASTAFGRFGYVPILSELQYLWLYLLNRKFDAHVFVSNMSKQGFGKYLTGVEAWNLRDVRARLPFPKLLPKMLYKDSYVFYNGADRSLFKPAHRPHPGYVIGCVGNFKEGKRQIDLINAMPLVIHEIPGVRLKFVGSGPTLKDCMHAVDEMGLNSCVEFLKEVGHEEIGNFYNGIDVLVLPSVNEAFCCVLVEAQACGVPFICTSRISAHEVLTEQSRRDFLYEPYNVKELAAKIVNVCKKKIRPVLSVNLDIDATTAGFLEWVSSKMRVMNA